MNDKFLAALRPYTLFILIFSLRDSLFAMNPNKPVGGFTITIPLQNPNRDPWAPKNPFDRDTNGYPVHGSHLLFPSTSQNNINDLTNGNLPLNANDLRDGVGPLLDTSVSYCTKNSPTTNNNSSDTTKGSKTIETRYDFSKAGLAMYAGHTVFVSPASTQDEIVEELRSRGCDFGQRTQEEIGKDLRSQGFNFGQSSTKPIQNIQEINNSIIVDEENKLHPEPETEISIPGIEQSTIPQEINESTPQQHEKLEEKDAVHKPSKNKNRQPRTPIDYYLVSELKDYKPMGIQVKGAPKAKKSPSVSRVAENNSFRDASDSDDSDSYNESAFAPPSGVFSFRPLNAENWESLDNGGVYALPSLVEKLKFYWRGTQQKEKKAYEQHIGHLQTKLSELTMHAVQEELYYQAKDRLLGKLQEDRAKFEHEKQKKKECAERFAKMAQFQQSLNDASQITIDNHVQDANHQVSEAEFDAAHCIERSLFGKEVADQSYLQNHALEQARLAREKAELQRDLVITARAKAPYVWDPVLGKIPALTKQEQKNLADLLANIPENIEEIAEQAAQQVEIIKSTHPDYQGANPPPSPNSTQRARAAMILSACKKAEAQKRAYVEHQEALQENQLLASLHSEAQDRKSGKKLVESLTSFVLQFFDGFRPKGPTNNPPALIPNKNMVVLEGYGPVTVVHPKAEVKPNSALLALANRWFGGSGSGGSKEPNKSKDEEKRVEWTAYGYKHIPQKNMSWKDIVKSTKNGGAAKYSPDIKNKIEEIERMVWEKGILCNDGSGNKIFRFDNVIGAYEGKETNVILVKMSSGTIHGHPISVDKYFQYI